MNRKKFQSIFFYELKIIILILIINLLSSLFFSTFLFSNFFSDNQKEIFLSIYEKINEVDDFDTNSEEFNYLIDFVRNNNCVLEIYDTNTNKRIYSPYVYDTDIFSSNDSKQIFDSLIDNEKDVIIVQEKDSETQLAINNLNKKNNMYSMLLRKSDNIYILVQSSMDIVNVYNNLLQKSLIWCFVLSFFVGLLPAFFLSKNLMDNILKIQRISNKISNGDFSEKCNASKFNEFFDLSNDINKMADNLNLQMNEISEKNKLLNEDIENRKKTEQIQKDFVSNVSHELKTPISIISGYTEGIKYNLVDTDEDRAAYCDIILQECERMKNIVKQLLDLSILENSIVLNIEKNDVSEMLNIILGKYINKNSDRTFVNNINCELYAYYDYDEIEKVIINYIDNAIKYSNEKIEIRAFYEGDYVYVGVHSKGHLDNDEMEKIWDRFYRIDKSHKRNENSTGLGLSIVKATMQKHEMPYGVINVNDGIEFYIRLKKIF